MKDSVQCFWRAVLASAFFAATVFPWRSAAVDLLVYNTHDSGAGSLRQAIANNRALGGGYTILFSNVVTGTITLTSGELLISNNVTIIGPGANVLTVSGNGASSVFDIAANTVVSLSGLTISDGLAGYTSGGGINNNQGTVIVNNCTFSGNSNVGDNGGGINNNHGTLTVNNCTFSGNSAYNYGGGIFNNGISGSATLTVVGCTFSGNSARHGGAIGNDGDRGIANLTVYNSTFSGNSSPDGGAINNAYGSVTVGDTILKTGTSGANVTNVGGTFSSVGFNLCSDNGGGLFTALGDQITEPMLGPLQDNGGPTPTMMPLPGSPAIDQGKNMSGRATDQRGRCRTYDDPGIPNAPGGDGSDIGAVEVNPAHVTPLVTTTVDGAVPGTLRYCICDAQPGEPVTFASNVTGTVTLTRGELLVSGNVSILGPGAKALAINGNAASPVFYTSHSVVNISGLTITNGLSPSGYGSGILNDHGTLTVSNCVISGNSAANRGAGIFNDGESGSASVTLAASTVSGNWAPNGAGIFNDATFGGNVALLVIASTVCGNAATYGGGVYNYSDSAADSVTVTVIGSTFSGNVATNGGLGGGIYNVGLNGGTATLQIGDTILKAGASGANIYNNGGTTTSLGYNLSDDNGGGVLTAIGDQINTEPMLGPLQDNGGPTLTMALLWGSPAIDKGNSFGLTTDQRGAPRPFDFPAIANASGGDGSDIGAFEVGQPWLSIEALGNAAVISWPNYYGNFSVQTNSSLTAPAGWANAPGTPAVIGTQYLLTNSPISGSSFFRLKSN